uniref:Uncharacterized protein n=1 Tax=Knipowitschia caucasica TaxID=637954 RepID=A0AAV2LEI7_KNICA
MASTACCVSCLDNIALAGHLWQAMTGLMCTKCFLNLPQSVAVYGYMEGPGREPGLPAVPPMLAYILESGWRVTWSTAALTACMPRTTIESFTPCFSKFWVGPDDATIHSVHDSTDGRMLLATKAYPPLQLQGLELLTAVASAVEPEPELGVKDLTQPQQSGKAEPAQRTVPARESSVPVTGPEPTLVKLQSQEKHRLEREKARHRERELRMWGSSKQHADHRHRKKQNPWPPASGRPLVRREPRKETEEIRKRSAEGQRKEQPLEGPRVEGQGMLDFIDLSPPHGFDF